MLNHTKCLLKMNYAICIDNTTIQNNKNITDIVQRIVYVINDNVPLQMMFKQIVFDDIDNISIELLFLLLHECRIDVSNTTDNKGSTIMMFRRNGTPYVYLNTDIDVDNLVCVLKTKLAALLNELLKALLIKFDYTISNVECSIIEVK